MKILWFSWKDINHPLAGGAEVVTDQILQRLVKDGHTVTLVTALYPGSKAEDNLNGYQAYRMGNRFKVYGLTRQFVRRRKDLTEGLVIEEINTIPFFSRRVVKHANRYLFFHQLAREIWFYQMFWPLSLIGYLIEPLYLRALGSEKVITVSNSTKQDLIRYGFKESSISIISEGITLAPVKDINQITKYPQPTIVSLGAVRAMKRTLEQIKAFEIAKDKLPDLQMKVAGSTSDGYGKMVSAYVAQSRYKDSIELLGRVSQEEKIELLQKSQVVTVTSVKEGWCLVVTEANSQGTPAVVYNVDGLRDSVKDGQTGLICPSNTPEVMATKLIELLGNKEQYQRLRTAGWQWSKEITFDRCYQDFKKEVGI